VSSSYPSGSKVNYTHAQWVTHNAILFGYKNYIEADSETKLTTGYHATTAVIHDSELMDVLLDKEEDSDQDLYADSAYRSEAIEMASVKKGIKSCIHEKGYRGRPLTNRQQERNRNKLKTRARVEHLFDFMTNSMNELHLCYRSFRRNATSHS
jgi:IS5 family transposase